jgi:hypothetical protein
MFNLKFNKNLTITQDRNSIGGNGTDLIFSEVAEFFPVWYFNCLIFPMRHGNR